MIEIERRRLIIDGRPGLIMSGEVHYFRIPRADWARRLDLVLELGLDCVASYIPWLFHEQPDGTIDVTGASRPERDLGAFIDLCAERGLTFFARPGPFVMAELKNEGLPFRLYREHPEIVPVGWDGRPAPTRTVDYLAPAFLSEVQRWYATVLPVLTQRLAPAGGPVIGVQLDNEVGMLAWVSNSPDLTDLVLGELHGWVRDRYGTGFEDRYPLPSGDPAVWARAVRSPSEEWAAALRVDLGWFMRERFARYLTALADMARAGGVVGVPLLINLHGTEGGNGVPFAIGVSQLFRSYAGQPGLIAGSDHYLGAVSAAGLADLHFVNAAMAATNGPDQPLTSLEFEAGTGDYSGGLDELADPATLELKTRLCLAQGNRLINYYLLAGGINPPLDEPVGDGNDRISFTGERHGLGAPIGPLGERNLTFAATAASGRRIQAHAGWLADLTEEHDDLAAGFWPDAFLTEYRYPASEIMTELVDDLTRFRGPGARKAWWRSLLWAGFRFSAVDLQDRRSTLPRTVALSAGRVLDAGVQHRLVDHVEGGGSLLYLGRLPERDLEGRPCRVLAEALGLSAGAELVGSDSYYPSVVGQGVAAGQPETRVGWLDELVAPSAEPLLRDVEGRCCGVTLTAGAGRAVVITAELPAQPALFSDLVGWLGTSPGLGLQTDIPGLLLTSGVTSAGERLFSLINPTGYSASVRLSTGDPTGVLDRPLTVPAHSGAFLGRGLRLPGGTELVSANAEIVAADQDRLQFAPGLGERSEVWLRTDRSVTGAEVRIDGHYTVVNGPAAEGLDLRLA